MSEDGQGDREPGKPDAADVRMQYQGQRDQHRAPAQSGARISKVDWLVVVLTGGNGPFAATPIEGSAPAQSASAGENAVCGARNGR